MFDNYVRVLTISLLSVISGIAHRDLKPENILCESPEKVLKADLLGYTVHTEVGKRRLLAVRSLAALPAAGTNLPWLLWTRENVRPTVLCFHIPNQIRLIPVSSLLFINSVIGLHLRVCKIHENCTKWMFSSPVHLSVEQLVWVIDNNSVFCEVNLCLKKMFMLWYICQLVPSTWHNN